MQDFEKLGVFYLGRLYDLANKTGLKDLLLYDSKDLVTHAICIADNVESAVGNYGLHLPQIGSNELSAKRITRE